MSLRPFLLPVILLTCTTVVHAVRPAATEAAKPATPAVTEPAKPAEPVPPYELKNRSAFTKPESVTRAPFWPIGWVPRGKGTVAVAQVQMPKVTLDAKSFKLTSILIGSGTTPSLAVINGRAYSEGEFIRMPKAAGTVPPRVRVQRINDGSAALQNGDQMFVVPLQRPELSNPKPEPLLNDQDR